MTSHPKILASHLARQAYVYVRHTNLHFRKDEAFSTVHPSTCSGRTGKPGLKKNPFVLSSVEARTRIVLGELQLGMRSWQ
jgi:hypothetical protein